MPTKHRPWKITEGIGYCAGFRVDVLEYEPGFPKS